MGVAEMEEKIRAINKAFDLIQPWMPQPNPHPQLKKLKELANNAINHPKDGNEMQQMFMPYLSLARHEEWHLLLVYIWGELLAPVEQRLYSTCGELHWLCSTLGAGIETSAYQAEQARGMQNRAFSPPPLSLPSRWKHAVMDNDPTSILKPYFGLPTNSLFFPMYDFASNRDVSRGDLADWVIRTLRMLVEKRQKTEQIQQVVREWRLKIQAPTVSNAPGNAYTY